MTFIKRDPEQPNLIDGTVLAYQAGPAGMYVTVGGNDLEQPLILAFDAEDVAALRRAIAEVEA